MGGSKGAGRAADAWWVGDARAANAAIRDVARVVRRTKGRVAGGDPLGGVHASVVEDGAGGYRLRLVATDGHRLHLVEVPGKAADEGAPPGELGPIGVLEYRTQFTGSDGLAYVDATASSPALEFPAFEALLRDVDAREGLTSFTVESLRARAVLFPLLPAKGAEPVSVRVEASDAAGVRVAGTLLGERVRVRGGERVWGIDPRFLAEAIEFVTTSIGAGGRLRYATFAEVRIADGDVAVIPPRGRTPGSPGLPVGVRALGNPYRRAIVMPRRLEG